MVTDAGCPPTSVMEFIRGPHQRQDQVLLQDGQPLVDVEVHGQRMVGRQAIGPLRPDLEHDSQSQPNVVDRRDPGVRVFLGQLETAAVVRKGIQKLLCRNTFGVDDLWFVQTAQCRVEAVGCPVRCVTSPAWWKSGSSRRSVGIARRFPCFRS